ncbi:MAG: hypothetical protein LHV69_02255 [Elusimicrobia bacterium]|nr:hypothetical protein [Candidatus Obscuribacterium magneticum]MCB4755849.1 hypothetical protein [Candidatus Obscuribacterium magneticum]
MKLNLKQMVIPLLVGLLIGGLLGRFASPWHYFKRIPMGNHEDRILKRFSSKLGLNPQQKEEIKAILTLSRKQTEKLLTDIRPKFEAIRKATAAEIRTKLTPEQQAKFDKMEKKFQHRRKGPHPPP